MHTRVFYYSIVKFLVPRQSKPLQKGIFVVLKLLTVRNMDVRWFELLFLKGMLNVTAEVVNDKESMINLWKHECSRVIADRFVNVQDNEWFQKALQATVEEDFGSESVALLQREPYMVDFLRDAPELTGKNCFSLIIPWNAASNIFWLQLLLGCLLANFEPLTAWKLSKYGVIWTLFTQWRLRGQLNRT